MQTDSQTKDGPATLRCGDGFGLLDIEQPDKITESGHFFFLRGWSHSGAEYGARMTREEVVQALVAKAGPGELVEKDGRFFFRPNSADQPCRANHSNHEYRNELNENGRLPGIGCGRFVSRY